MNRLEQIDPFGTVRTFSVLQEPYENGIYWHYAEFETEAGDIDIQNLLSQHHPSLEELQLVEKINAARTNMQNIPDWATWDEQQALDWGDTNIGTPLADGRANLPATLTLATTRLAILGILDILDAMWTFRGQLCGC